MTGVIVTSEIMKMQRGLELRYNAARKPRAGFCFNARPAGDRN